MCARKGHAHARDTSGVRTQGTPPTCARKGHLQGRNSRGMVSFLHMEPAAGKRPQEEQEAGGGGEDGGGAGQAEEPQPKRSRPVGPDGAEGCEAPLVNIRLPMQGAVQLLLPSVSLSDSLAPPWAGAAGAATGGPQEGEEGMGDSSLSDSASSSGRVDAASSGALGNSGDAAAEEPGEAGWVRIWLEGKCREQCQQCLTKAAQSHEDEEPSRKFPEDIRCFCDVCHEPDETARRNTSMPSPGIQFSIRSRSSRSRRPCRRWMGSGTGMGRMWKSSDFVSWMSRQGNRITQLNRFWRAI